MQIFSLKNEEEKKKAITFKVVNFSVLFLSFIFLISFSSAALQLGLDSSSDGIGVNFRPADIPLNQSNLSVLSANIWNTTSLGELTDANTTQFFSNGGVLNILESHLDSLYCQKVGCTMEGILNFSGFSLCLDIGCEANLSGSGQGAGVMNLNAGTLLQFNSPVVAFGTGSSSVAFNINHLSPTVDGGANLGTPLLRWNETYIANNTFSNGSAFYDGNVTLNTLIFSPGENITANITADTITFNTDARYTFNGPVTKTEIVGISATGIDLQSGGSVLLTAGFIFVPDLLGGVFNQVILGNIAGSDGTIHFNEATDNLRIATGTNDNILFYLLPILFYIIFIILFYMIFILLSPCLICISL